MDALLNEKQTQPASLTLTHIVTLERINCTVHGFSTFIE